MVARRRAITLVEVLILAIIVAVIIGTIVPEFHASTHDTKMSNLKYNMHLVRARLEQFRDQHHGEYPVVRTGEQFCELFTRRSVANGRDGSAQNVADRFLDNGFPENPFNRSSSVAIISGDTEPATTTGGSEGWQYNPRHGWFYPNCNEYFQSRSTFSPQN